ncbi:MAG: hypothetical protein P4L10_15250, partial [Acidobacteriaceae bacterium]|nr:hypothetical protein [Acidobacteriaceae bacterium]
CAGAQYLHYGFHSISTALVERCCCRRERTLPSIEPEQPTRYAVGEEHSQSLARPESIGVLACEAMHSETFIPKRKYSLPQYWRGYANIPVAPALPTPYLLIPSQYHSISIRIWLVILSAAKNLKSS